MPLESQFCIEIDEIAFPSPARKGLCKEDLKTSNMSVPPQKLSVKVGSRSSSVDPKARSSSSSNGGHKRTTVMIRNIPSGYKQDELIEEVSHFGLKINFAYLPCKQSAGNAGFAFLNFLCPQDATDFIKQFRGHVFVRQTGVKRAKVMFAKVQGLEANVSRHEGTKNSKPWVLGQSESEGM
jgi:RNA recognition motif-containing protein